MTPSDYGQGRSLDHDRMQANVLDFLRSEQPPIRTVNLYGAPHEIRRVGVWPEVMLKIGDTVRGFVDILERWQSVSEKDRQGRIGPELSVYYAYEIKPKLTSIGGLIRQMQAEEVLIEQWAKRDRNFITTHVHVAPVIDDEDPERQLLRRLWGGKVFLWNAEAMTLT